MLAGRRIVLGITGGIAAYKAGHLLRLLVAAGAEVETIMTEAALEFLGPQTPAALSGRQPHTSLFDDPSVSPHTDLARWAHAIVIAPATTATLARIATGISTDLLVATVLAARCPVVLAPAMHSEMWDHPATQRNISTLAADGYRLVGPEMGQLAGGDEGIGRMSEPEAIVAGVATALGAGDLDGLQVVVSAGGTREPIDPVRFVGNRSTGKMGHAIAAAAAGRGATVELVTAAPVASVGQLSGIKVTPVDTAEEMAAAVWEAGPRADVVVLAAAVADFRPREPGSVKLRRRDGLPDLEFEATPDILAGIAALEDPPFLVGFAAETGSLDGAVRKARDKGVDLLVANDVSRAGSGFGTDTNEVTLITPDGATEPWELLTKAEVAGRLWDRVLAMLPADAGEDR